MLWQAVLSHSTFTTYYFIRFQYFLAVFFLKTIIFQYYLEGVFAVTIIYGLSTWMPGVISSRLRPSIIHSFRYRKESQTTIQKIYGLKIAFMFNCHFYWGSQPEQNKNYFV